VAGYKINLQKSLSFLYTNNEQTEKIYGKNSIHNSLKKEIKYLGVNLTKDMNDLYKEKYKLQKKEIEVLNCSHFSLHSRHPHPAG
jgi:hypothetical protein